MKWIVHIAVLLFSITVFGQNPEGFDEMVDDTLEGRIPTVSIYEFKKALSESDVFVLDAREKNEYRVSHIFNAIHVGYDKFNPNQFNGLPRDIKMYVYCSIGYRSEKIGLLLRKAGFYQVYNLYGGIFNWYNNGFPVYAGSKQVKKIHGYNAEWAKWLNPEKGKIILK